MTDRMIALLTDFGWAGHFAGSMKAVILGINSEATIIDITHGIAPQAVEEGAFTLGAVMPFLPPNSVCVAVVDPGVGTSRAPIALETERGIFIGPDNGVLSAALADEQRPAPAHAGRARPVAVPPGCRAFQLNNPRYFHMPVSNTFHGRDIFAPVAAHISSGLPLDEVGDPVATVLAFPPWRAPLLPDGSLAGRVLSVDHFGNLITDVLVEDLGGRPVSTEVGGLRIAGPSQSYQDGSEFLVYPGSSGYLEIARRNGSAAQALAASAGTPVRVTTRRRGGSAGRGRKR